MAEDRDQNLMFLRESDAGIEAEPGRGWKTIELCFDRQEMLSCLPKDSDLSAESMFGFDEEKYRIMITVAYLFGLPPEYEKIRRRLDDIVTRRILKPPTIDDQIERLAADSDVRDALVQRNNRSGKLRHLAFLTVLKRRGDALAQKLKDPRATNSERAVSMGELWRPVTAADIDDVIADLE